MFSQASEYALRAMAELARKPAGEWVLTSQLASNLELPAHYLAKVLQTLARRGLLDSQRGRQGGFRLAHSPESITAYDVVHALDDVRMFETCIMGESSCSDETACPLHSLWKGIRNSFLEVLQTTTMRDFAEFQDRRPISGRLRRVFETPPRFAPAQRTTPGKETS
jgi:Rrf2 family transcriptional regulator, iron-sulfur cluster assembly transcription factor